MPIEFIVLIIELILYLFIFSSPYLKINVYIIRVQQISSTLQFRIAVMLKHSMQNIR